ncbi:MAG: hypothetical protein ABWK15_05255 [Dissulfuribacterales bacterium]
MELEGYCFKDKKQIPINAGCCHPNDYCKDRTACMVHFLEQERKKTLENRLEEGEKNADTAHQ